MTVRAYIGLGSNLGDRLAYLQLGVESLARVGGVVGPLIMLSLMRHKDRAELDHYGKYRGSGPAKSFVCPECLTRSYAPSHVARRWCAKCDKTFPPGSPKAWRPEAQPAE